MRILLDTSAFLWWITDAGAALTDTARSAIADPDNRIFVSAASAWEIAVKAERGRLTIDDPERAVPVLIDRYGFESLPIELGHALRAGALPSLHRDPFDRVLIAQGQIERMPIVTPDNAVRRYEVETIW